MDKQNNIVAKARLERVIRNLKIKYTDFLYPLSQMKLEEKRVEANEGERLSTDGLKIFYSSDYVLKYTVESLEVEIMHIILHGMLGHFLIKDKFQNKPHRDVLMDIQVTHLLNQMEWKKQDHLLRYAARQLENNFSMSQYYRMQNDVKTAANVCGIAGTIKSDEHGKWDEDESERYQKELEVFWMKALASFFSEEEIADGKLFDGILLKTQIFGTQKGESNASFAVGKENRRSYKEILNEILQVQEVNREVPDSIDPMLYHYGLELYEDVPLIEPLESNDMPALRTLAIAVDVSGSCVNKETMGQFWGETYACIEQLRDVSKAGEVLLIQCDADIQKVQRMELEEFDREPEQVDVKGCGGTDFRPVFKYLKEKETEGEIIDALIYLSDGEGSYPEMQPDYPVYFVMEEKSEWVYRRMPNWIERVYLE